MNIPKLLAVYLPQFHETDNNNKWWGKGFTDWISVKQAEPLFEGHEQPRVPTGLGYYDLSDVNNMRKQAELAREYGVDGFMFYHYYFGANRMELYKPAENYLRATDIDFPFCFCWANESWVRTWSRISGNAWGEKYEQGSDDGGRGILALQNYGGEEEWERHFHYLLPFFQDERYIKVENKPVITIFSVESVPSLSDMVKTWRDLAKQSGFSGLYVIGENTDSGQNALDAVALNEPDYGMGKMRDKGRFSVFEGVTCFDYHEYWNEVLAAPPILDVETVWSVAPDRDTTPRRGNSGECFINCSARVFGDGLKQVILKAKKYGSRFIFINAWNEWGEGMYLEPDRKRAYAYLEAVKKAKEEASVSDFKQEEADQLPEYVKKQFENTTFLMNKFKAYYKLLLTWLMLEQEKQSVFGDYFSKHGIKSVAIYGYSDIGRLLHDQLRREKIFVSYAVDRYVGSAETGFRIFRLEETLPEAELIIITVYASKQISDRLKTKFSGRIQTIWGLMEHIINET